MHTLIYRDRSAVFRWLVICLLCVTMMVLVGGYTRLSGSGLSITEWKPLHGIIPPLNDQDWQQEFAGYKESPQYKKINSNMALDDFKTIFWPEFLHRALGRLIGVVFLFPLLVFAARRSFSKSFGFRLLFIFALGGAQGLVGWLMVKSGLIDNPYVSHIRLSLHLGLAFLLFALILWAALDVASGRQSSAASNKKDLLETDDWRQVTYIIWFALLCAQIIFGGFMAGLHAGLIYNTWPTMNGQWFPSALWHNIPWFENITLIQFIHRKLAVMVVLGFILWWYFARYYVSRYMLGTACWRVFGVMCVQFILGVSTLLVSVPLKLALLHQMTALLLFALAVILLHGLWGLKNEYGRLPSAF